MRRKKVSPEEHAADKAFLKCFANCPVPVLQLSELFIVARKAYSEHGPVYGDLAAFNAMVAYAEAHNIPHN